MAWARSLKGKLRLGRFRPRPGLVSFALFSVVAGALLGTILLLFTTVETERQQRRQVTRTNDILLAMAAIDRAAVNGETGQRGYFITADQRYLEPFHFGKAQYPKALERLKRLVGPDAPPRQQALVDEIERLSDAKWAEMTDTIELVREGRIVEAHTRLLSDEGQLAMLRLRTAIGELERIERSALDKAARRTADAESRVVPALASLSLLLLAALALGLWQVIRMARIEAAALNAAAIAEARDRADLLAHELNHRVKNLFAVILAIVKMSGKDAPEAKPVIDSIAGRIHALVRAHEVSQGASSRSRISLRELVATAVAPYTSDSVQCDAAGPDVTLSERNTVPIGLVLHELVTNAVKYGAWSQPGGVVQVRWREQDGRVTLDWVEEGTHPVEAKPERNGFGTMLIDSAARQMDGTIARSYESQGIRVRVEFAAGDD